MNAWVIFRRARIILFSFLILICLAWSTLFTIFLVREWPHFSQIQKIVIVCLLSLYGFTTILLYLMVVVQFRYWWDVGRVIALLVVHAGASLLFTHFSPGFPCRGFGTRTACRGFVFTIFIGCWAFSGIVLCFAVILGVMAFVPRPVKPLSGEKEDGWPPSPGSFTSGDLSNEQRPLSIHSIDSHTGLVPYKDQGEFPQETLSSRDDPRNPTDIVSGLKRADSSYRDPFRDPSSPPVSIYSRTSVVQNIRSPVSPKPIHVPLAIHSNDSPPGTTPHGIPNSTLGHYSIPATLGDKFQPAQTSPRPPRTASPSGYSFHSTAASVHSKWAASVPQVPLPPVLPPGAVRTRKPGAFPGPQGLSFAYSAPSNTWGSNVTLKRNFTEPTKAVQRHGVGWARRSYMPPAAESSQRRRAGDVQVLDQSQWQRLVLTAAAKS
ncbi:hypothetical protein BJV78DRAFT_305465 [Lactifluus subvellereus]|nr:hypothetical protein BJV78DRAFT_305465 [Lactifluus subvellereus]